MKKKFVVTLFAATIVVAASGQNKKASPPKPPPPPTESILVPPPPPPPPAITVETAIEEMDALPNDYQDFLTRNPNVASLRWKKNYMVVVMKSGVEETYPQTSEGIKQVEAKYGKLPIAPPPPPPAPPVPPPPPKVNTLS